MNGLYKLAFTVVLAALFSMSLYADGKPAPLASNQIKIDGDSSDWGQIPAYMNEFGMARKDADNIDVKSFYMGYTKEDFVFKADLSPAPSILSPGEDLSIFQLFFDADTNDTTGSRSDDVKIYKVNPKGFETRFELILTKNKTLVGRLYSHEDKFTKLIKEWTSGSANIAGKGGTVEIKIPYSLINFTPSNGIESIRILFAEYANMTSKDGYSKQSIKLDYTVAVKAPPASSSSEDGGSSGFNIWHLIILTIWIVSILCGFAIAPKAGLSSGLAALNLIPFLGQLIFLFVLAFGQWPLHKDYQKLEDRLREFDEEV